jgi:hypothetical protein
MWPLRVTQQSPLAGSAAGGAEIRKRRHVDPLRVTQLLRPAHGPRFSKGPAAGGAVMCMCRRVAPAASARPVVPVGPTAGCAASYSAVQLWRGQRTARCPSWALGRLRPAEHVAWCLSCGVANGVVNQVVPSCTAHGSSELVKDHTPRRGRLRCCNTPPGGLVWAAPWSRSGTGPLPLQTRQVSYGEVLVISWIQPSWESVEVLQPEANGPRRRTT